MKNGEIIEILEKFAPPSLAEEWDRVGLMLGTRRSENTGVLVTLDVTPEAVAQAEECGANLIVSHHPFIWDALPRIDEDTPRGAMYARLIRDGISVYSMHTNLDKADGGINDRLAAMLGGKDILPDGVGRVFSTGDITLGELAKRVADALGDKTTLVVGDPSAIVRKAYVVGGAGASEYDRAKEVADVLISGEFKHHQYLDAPVDGFALIEFSHFFSEIIMQEILSDALAPHRINIIKATKVCPFRRIEEI